MRKLLYIGNKLSKHGATVTGIEVLGPLLEEKGFRLTYASSKKNKLARLAEMVLKTLGKKPDYVLIDTYSTSNFWYAFAVSQICRWRKIRYVPILHGGNLAFRLKKNPELCRMIFAHSYCNAAPSGYLQQAFSDAGFNVVCIPNPFEAAEFPFMERTGIKPKLLWVRSVAPIYNPEMALDVLAWLQPDFPDAALCMVGPDKGGMLAQLKQKAALRNLNVSFTGRLPKAEWAELSKRYDIFINTSRTDNAPFSLIEAASLGMAIVSTNVGGIPYLFEDRKTAMLVPDTDAKAMAAAIRDIISNPGLAETILTGARKLANDSNRNLVAEKWLEILI